MSVRVQASKGWEATAACLEEEIAEVGFEHGLSDSAAFTDGVLLQA